MDIEVRPATGAWVVRAGSAVLGESRAAPGPIGGNRAPVMYFLRTEVAMEFLDRSGKVTTCPWKGDATCCSIVTTFTTLRDVAWSCRASHGSAFAIRDHVAFHPHDEFAIERP